MRILSPDPNVCIRVDNMVSQWGDTEGSHLSVVLVHLRHLSIVHQTNHWQTKGDPFYGDHLLFSRLYDAVNDEIDTVAEKAIGIGSIDAVDMPLQVKQLNYLSSNSVPVTGIPQTVDLAKRSLQAELNFQNVVQHVVNQMDEFGLLTRGVDNMLAGIQDLHESHVYLLKQRCTPQRFV